MSGLRRFFQARAPRDPSIAVQPDLAEVFKFKPGDLFLLLENIALFYYQKSIVDKNLVIQLFFLFSDKHNLTKIDLPASSQRTAQAAI